MWTYRGESCSIRTPSCFFFCAVFPKSKWRNKSSGIIWLLFNTVAQHKVRLTVKLSSVGFCEELSNSVSRDGKSDSRRHFESVYADDVSILSKTQTGQALYLVSLSSRTHNMTWSLRVMRSDSVLVTVITSLCFHNEDKCQWRMLLSVQQLWRNEPPYDYILW